MLEGRHFQNAYVTRDVDGWVEKFKARGKVDAVLTHEGTTEVWTPEGMASQTCKLAFVWIDNLQYELIQPIDGAVGIYRDALPEGDGLAFHHICMRLPSWDDFRARVDRQPLPVVLERSGGTAPLQFLYLDARPMLGHYLEYVCMPDQMWAGMGGR